MLSLSLSMTSRTLALNSTGVVQLAPVISITSDGGYAGSVYTATPGVWSGGVPSGEWYADELPIAGATGSTWTMTLNCEGKAIRYRESVGNAVSDSNVIEMWVPQDAAGLVALMDVRQGLTLAGSAVTAWVSQVGGIAASQSTGSSQPAYGATAFNGAPGLTFDGGDALSDLGVTGAPVARSWIGGAMFNANGADQSLMGPQTTNGYRLQRSVGTQMAVIDEGVAARATSSGQIASNVPVVLSSRITANGPYAFRSNGASIGAGTVSGGFSGTGVSRIGSDNAGARRMAGTITSHAVYDTHLSDANIARAEGWIAWTLGKASLLDAAHTYRNIGPRVQ